MWATEHGFPISYTGPITTCLVNATVAVYRRFVRCDVALAGGLLTMALLPGCTTVDPGPNFVVPDEQFNSNYFYCHVEPQVIFAKKCGDQTSGSCHFTPSAVSGMALLDHTPVDCGGGDTPLDMTQTGQGSAARSNFSNASTEMDHDYLSAPFYLRPTEQTAHPVKLFNSDPNDPIVKVIAAWAQK